MIKTDTQKERDAVANYIMAELDWVSRVEVEADGTIAVTQYFISPLDDREQLRQLFRMVEALQKLLPEWYEDRVHCDPYQPVVYLKPKEE